MTTSTLSKPTSLNSLSDSELKDFAEQLGLELRRSPDRKEIERRVQEHCRRIDEISPGALDDVAKWARHTSPISDRLAFARMMMARPLDNLYALTTEGLRALAILRGMNPPADEARHRIEGRMLRRVGLLGQVRRIRHQVEDTVRTRVAAARRTLSRAAFDAAVSDLSPPSTNGGQGPSATTRKDWVSGGIAGRIKHVADDYIREKLDEIEIRIDRKLDEIDLRMTEWRDAEINHRLRILKYTLLFTVIVAVLCLAYDALSPAKQSPASLRTDTMRQTAETAEAAAQESTSNPGT